MCEIKWRKSAKPTFTQLYRRSTAALMIIATFSHNILGYSDAAQLQRRNSDAVTELVLRWSVYWPNRLGWCQKVLQPPSTFMILSWWCPLGHWKLHLPAKQFILAGRLIPILTHLSSCWTVPLRYQSNMLVSGAILFCWNQFTLLFTHSAGRGRKSPLHREPDFYFYIL